MYYVLSLEDDGDEFVLDEFPSSWDAICMVKEWIKGMQGILVVEDVDGGIWYEALNDGSDIVTIQPLREVAYVLGNS